ncbi:hypothetical protein ACHAXT_012515 [Thalassiosira profunda]
MEDAPASPRSAALYYWGGDWGGEEEKVADEGNLLGGPDDDKYADLYHSTFQQRASVHRRRPARVKFTLTLQDEGDADHWMFAVPPLPVSDEEEKEENENPSPTNVDSGGDFADPTAEACDFDAIPVIDLSQPTDVYAKQIGDACRNVGFFYIINHGVSEDVMEGVMDKSKRFFDLDLKSKLNAGKQGQGYRGYFEVGGEDLDNKDGTRDLVAEEGKENNQNATKKRVAGDFKEGFDCGLESADDACTQFFGDNVWPDESNNTTIAGFRETLLRYQAQLIGLSDKLLLALGKSLNNNPNEGCNAVPEDHFIRCSRSPLCTLRLLHYPPANDIDATQGCGAHTDYGLFTILQQDSIGGLQVRNSGKEWIAAKPLPGSFVINVGDMLSHWTNGEYASTVHRVQSPRVCGDTHRYSVPFFFNPDHDAVVQPLACAGSGDRAGGSRTALEILRSRYEGTFQTK